ncbi:MAG: polysulfide reductase NrfD [Peptococcaceae bacterium]|nr:polysulfide reductase NrfD [Peptococcaceae bacterium]
MTNSASNEAKRSTAGNLILPVAGLLAVIGVACWVVQLIVGPSVLADTIPWGVYIAAFFLLAGAGSGLVMMAAAGDWGILPALKDWRRSLLIGAAASYIAAGFMILLDLGQPVRIYNFFVSPNFTSMFVWDFLFLLVTVVLVLICFFRKETSKWLLGLTAVTALGIVLIEGWILAVNPVTVWNSALIPVVFLVEAIVVAVAVLLAAKGDAFESLKKILIGLLPLLLIFSLIEMFAGNYMGASQEAAGTKLLLTGSLAPFYWGWVVLGVALPFVLLLWKGARAGAVKLAAVLAVCGVLLAKINLLVAGQALPFEGGTIGYFPSIVEIGGMLGGLGLAVFLFVLGKNFFGDAPAAVEASAETEEAKAPAEAETEAEA